MDNNLQNFRNLWINFLNLKTTLKIKFKTVDNLINCNFWLSTNLISEKCNICNCNMIGVFYFNSNNNLFFEYKFKFNNYLLCFCEKCKQCSLLTNVNIDEILILKNNNFLVIEKIESLIDYETSLYDVPIIDSESCCGNYKLKMSQVNIENNKTISKIGGIDEIIDRKKYKIINYLKCKCYNPTDKILILSLKAKDCEILRKLNIFVLEVSKCSTCNNLHFNVFSHELNMDYKMVLFQNDDEYYHIISSDNKLNGVVLISSLDIYDLFICCQLINYTNTFEFTNTKKISKEINNIFKLEIWDENILKVTNFIKKIKNENIKTIELYSADEIYGNTFYLTKSLDEDEYLVELKNDELFFHGYIVEKELIKLTTKQKELILDIGANVI